MKVPIQEVFTWPKRSSILRVDEGQVELGVGASFMANLIDENDRVTVNCGRVRLTQEQYGSWLQNDEQVGRWVAQNLGLVPVVPPVEAPQ